ncbi:nicotinamide riboside transporter PnuC [Parashewanella hymeniacidonis]|uniref:nicotinamide riboside transporter PnuC n=1 Tax=Parashewanella hymeniacidonis TaxID=2807618 RepID=UPI0030844CDF
MFGEMQAMTLWESLAVVLALAYLLLAMKESIWCWPAAFVSSGIYMVIFWNVNLYMEAVLSLYYVAMAVYGYWMWTRGGQQHHGVSITSWPLKTHMSIIIVTGVIALIVGYMMANNTDASFPYLDAATTCFAIMTTYLVAKKILENWLYWIVINSVSIYLYLNKELMLTSALFVLYVILAFAGYMQWQKSKTRQATA